MHGNAYPIHGAIEAQQYNHTNCPFQIMPPPTRHLTIPRQFPTL